MSARLNASTVPMSGFTAPARTASPTAERVTSAVPWCAILPACTSASSSGRGNSATSNGAPASISLCKADVKRNSISTLQLLVRSNNGTTSSISDRIAPPLRILIAGAIASFTIAMKKGAATPAAPSWFLCERRRLLRRGQCRGFRGRRSLHGLGLFLLLALGENECVTFDRHFADL